MPLFCRSIVERGLIIDTTIQRAILLKAILEALQKDKGVSRLDIEREQPEALRNSWTRSNASHAALARGMDGYAKSVGRRVEQYPDLLPQGPFWDDLVRFAVTGVAPSTTAVQVPEPPVHHAVALPRTLVDLENWMQRPNNRVHTLAEMAGCWWLCRLTSQLDTVAPEVTISLLNIRPERVLKKSTTPWTEFAIYLPADTDSGYRVRGICTPMGDHLNFIGLLDKNNHNYPTAMSLQYPVGGAVPVHKVQADGLMYITNSKSKQVSAPVFARYIAESSDWIGEKYDSEKYKMLKMLGSFNQKDIEEILPTDEYVRLKEKTAQGTIFEVD